MYLLNNAFVAQRTEHSVSTRLAAGSTPAEGAGGLVEYLTLICYNIFESPLGAHKLIYSLEGGIKW